MTTVTKIVFNTAGRAAETISECFFGLRMGLDLTKEKDKKLYDDILTAQNAIKSVLRDVYLSLEQWDKTP